MHELKREGMSKAHEINQVVLKKNVEDYLLCDVAKSTSVEHLDGKVEIMLLEQCITMKGPSQHKGANVEHCIAIF